MDEIEKSLSAELEERQAALDAGQTQRSGESLVESIVKNEDGEETDVAKSAMLDKLEDKKKELVHFIITLSLHLHLHFIVIISFHFSVVILVESLFILLFTEEKVAQFFRV